MADTRARIIIDAQDRATAVMKAIGDSGKRLQSSLDGLGAPFLRLQTLGASLISGVLVAGIRNLVGALDDLDEAAQGLGTTAVELASLQQAFADSGVGAEKLERALTRLNVMVAEARGGGAEAVATFRAFGSAELDAAVKSGDTVRALRAMADAFAALEDGPDKVAIATKFFGEKLAKDMIPALNQGGESLKRFTGLTEDHVREAAALQGQIDKLTNSFKNLALVVGGNLAAAINKLFDRGSVTQRIAELEQIIRSMEHMQVGDPANLARYREELAKLKVEAAAAASAVGAMPKADPGEVLRRLNEAAAIEKQAAALKKLLAERANEEVDRLRREAQKETDALKADADRRQFDSMRDLLRLQREQNAELEAENQFERDRLEILQLSGKAEEERKRRLAEVLETLRAIGEVDAAEAEKAVKGIAGISDAAKEATNAAEQLGLTISSSLGELITSGGKAGDVFKALAQDVLKLITQMLILKPLAEELKRIFEGISLGGGGGSSNLLSGLISGISGLFGGGGGSSALPVGGMAAGASVPRTTVAFATAAPQITVNIASGVDRAGVALAVERGVRAGLARSYDSTRRGGAGVFA